MEAVREGVEIRYATLTILAARSHVEGRPSDLQRIGRPARWAEQPIKEPIMSHHDGKADRVWTLMNEIGVAMVVTHKDRGDELRARPMAARLDGEENAIYFLTDAAAPKDGEVDRNPNICLAFSDIKGQKYVSLTGRGEISNDRAKIKQFWSVGDKVFWPDADDPAIRLLRVAPEDAEYWEGAGLIVSSVRMIASAISGARPELGDNEKVNLSRRAAGA
jgi:general stress protein 26